MTPRPRVWITRARPGADRTAGRLRDLGLEPVVRPLLALEPLSPDLPDLGRFAALAFTSSNGVAAFAALAPRRDRPVFAVGDATAHAAREAGFTDVRSAAGALGDLARLIAATAPGPLLAPGAETPSGDLARAVRDAGGDVEVQPLPVYRAAPTGAEPPLPLDAVLIHSPRAAGELAARPALPAALVVACISPAAAAPLEATGRACAVAEAPHEAALLAALQQALGKRAPPV